MRFPRCIAQVGMRLCKKKKNEKSAILRLVLNIFVFGNCCKPTFSQIDIIVKFLKNLVKEGLNFVRWLYVKDFVTVNVKYCGIFLA